MVNFLHKKTGSGLWEPVRVKDDQNQFAELVSSEELAVAICTEAISCWSHSEMASLRRV